jgi:hypothetical protein
MSMNVRLYADIPDSGGVAEARILCGFLAYAVSLASALQEFLKSL